MTTDYAKGARGQDAELGPGGGRDRGRRGRRLVRAARTSCASTWAARARDIAVVRRRRAAADARPSTSSGACRSASRRIDVISIGAGGGSIAWLDPAGYPRSGPQSAGADPGPACYGKGGTEPTNTDAHLVLGRVTNDLFLDGRMQLDVELARARRSAADRRAARALSVEDAAEGVLRIANANMVKAIRLVTVERGFDPRDFSLVAFGGAGPAARRRPRARAADARGDRPGLSRRDERAGSALRRSARRLLLGVRAPSGRDRPRGARQRLRGDGRPGRRQPRAARASSAGRRSCSSARIDLRYIGQLHSVTVPLTEISEDGFAASGRLRSTTSTCGSTAIRHPEQPVETSTLRVAARGARAKPDLVAASARRRRRRAQRPSASGRSTSASTAGSTTRVLDRNSLAPGRRSSRAVRSSSSSTRTIVLPPGTAARVDEVGNMSSHLERERGRTSACTDDAIDPITFEVLRNAFMSVVDEMGLMLERVGHSLVVSEGRDFSAAICDADGRMVAEGKEDLPAHVGRFRTRSRRVISWIGKDRIHEGDIFIMNDAFLGGTHCQDVRTIMPVFRDGELVAFVQNSAHWSDAGGPVPGSFHAEAPSTLRRGPVHPADPSRPRGRARRRGACASSSQRPRSRDHARRRASPRSPPAGPARRACRR